jgi:hypothetical protein
VDFVRCIHLPGHGASVDAAVLGAITASSFQDFTNDFAPS